jgi:putative transferase (TIGR04331 family)
MREFRPDEMAVAIKQSRELLPHSLDALCAVITEATGRVPNRAQVEHVSLFWLMRICDKVVATSESTTQLTSVAVEPMGPGVQSNRSRIFQALSSPRAAIAIVDPYLKVGFGQELSAVLRARKKLRWGHVNGSIPPVSAVNAQARLAIAQQVKSSTSLVERLQRTVALTAPIEIVEQCQSLGEWAENASSATLRLLYTANAHQSSAFFRYLAWVQRQMGTKIAIHQHGGGYGIDEQHIGEDHDIAISDVFYTFGWQRPDLGRRVRSLPTAMPERAKKSELDGYLLISLPIFKRFYRLQAFLMPAHIELAVSETISFVNELDADTDLCVRSSGADEFPVSRLVGAQAKITHDTGRGRGSVAASRAKLTIHNYLGTSWLETLAMNIPTVCFYDPTMYRPRAAAQPFIDALVRVGVVHYSGREAAKFVNSLRGDPSSWWRSTEVQEAREAFVARYANFSDNWLNAWQAEFESLLAE